MYVLLVRFSSTETGNLLKLCYLIPFNVTDWRRWGFCLLPSSPKEKQCLVSFPTRAVGASVLFAALHRVNDIYCCMDKGRTPQLLCAAWPCSSIAELHRPWLVVGDTTSLLVCRLRSSERTGASNPALGVEQSLLFVVKQAARQLCHGCAFWQQYGHLAFLQTRLLLSLIPWAGTTLTKPSTTARCSRNVLWHMPQKITNGAWSVS